MNCIEASIGRESVVNQTYSLLSMSTVAPTRETRENASRAEGLTAIAHAYAPPLGVQRTILCPCMNLKKANVQAAFKITK